jgi:hypothetical protein
MGCHQWILVHCTGLRDVWIIAHTVAVKCQAGAYVRGNVRMAAGAATPHRMAVIPILLDALGISIVNTIIPHAAAPLRDWCHDRLS